MAKSRRTVTAWVVASVFAIAFFVRVVAPSAVHLTYGFSSYYTAAHLIREGYDAASFYDDAWFHEQTIRLGFIGAEDIYNANPPTAALIMLLITGLTPRAARLVWTAVEIGALVAAIAIWARATASNSVAVAVGVIIVATFQPLRAELRLGQVYVVLLLLETLACASLMYGRDRLAGAFVSGMLSFKTAGILLPLLFVAQRRWTALLATMILGAAVALASLPILGIGAWATYLGLLVSFGGHPELASPSYQSLPGLVFHLFRDDRVWNPTPLANAPTLATLLVVASSLAIIVVGFVATRCRGLDDRWRVALAFSVWTSSTIALSPVTEDYHATLLLLPLAVILGTWQTGRTGVTPLALTAVALVLLDAPLPYLSPALAHGAYAVFAYPKLYGDLALWAACIVSLQRIQASTDSAGAS